MHSFRIRYVVLGLLVYVHSAFCRACGSNFDDVPSSSVLAAVVFEGSVYSVEEIMDQRGGTDNVLYSLVHFKVRRLYKGQLPRSGSGRKRPAPVLVGKFSSNPDLDKCVSPMPQAGQQYVVFLNSTERTTGVDSPSWQRPGESADWSASAPLHYPLSAIPVPSSKKILRQVRDYTCKNCGKEPTARLTRPSLQVKEGDRVQLHCRVHGKPTPVAKWYLNGNPIDNDDRHYVISRTKRGSRLRVKKAGLVDAGQYACQAVSAMGNSPLATARVTVLPDAAEGKADSGSNEGNLINVVESSQERRLMRLTNHLPSSKQQALQASVGADGVANLHHVLCEKQTYCLNGGVCYQMTSLGHMYCECKQPFSGPRCSEKQPDPSVTDIIRTGGKRDSHSQDRTRTITGLVIGVVILAIIFIASYILAKKRRTEFRKRRVKRREERDRANNNSNGVSAAQPLLLQADDRSKRLSRSQHTNHGIDCGVQTEDFLTPSPSDDNSLPPYNGQAPSSKHLPRQNTAPSRLQVPEGGRSRLNGVSITPDLPMCRPQAPNVAVVNAIVEPNRQVASPSDLDKLSEFAASDLEVNMESEADVAGLDGSDGSDGEEDDHAHLPIEPLTPSTPSEDEEASTTSDSSIGEEIALFQQLARNPRVPSTPSHTSQNSLTWPSDFATPNSPIMSPRQVPPPPYSTIHNNGHAYPPKRRSSRTSPWSDDYDPSSEFPYPYDPDPDATVV